MLLEVFFEIVNVAPPPPNGGVHSGLCGQIYYQKDASKNMRIAHQNNLSIELIVPPPILKARTRAYLFSSFSVTLPALCCASPFPLLYEQ